MLGDFLREGFREWSKRGEGRDTKRERSGVEGEVGTKEEKKQVFDSYTAIKNSFNAGAKVRDGLIEDLAEHADANQIFEHGEQLDTLTITKEWPKGPWRQRISVHGTVGRTGHVKPAQAPMGYHALTLALMGGYEASRGGL